MHLLNEDGTLGLGYSSAHLWLCPSIWVRATNLYEFLILMDRHVKKERGGWKFCYFFLLKCVASDCEKSKVKINLGVVSLWEKGEWENEK